MIKILFLILLVGQTDDKKEVPVYCDHADYWEYVEKEGNVYAKGNVILRYENITMKADEIKLNKNTNEVEAKGHIFITEKEQEIRGDTANYNLETKKGTVTNVDFYSKPWYFKGENVDKPTEKEVYIKDSNVTTCKYKDAPHYHIWSKKIHIEQDEKIEGWSNLLYVGPVPVFYLPYFYRSLKDNKSPLSLRVGYSDYEGFYIKSTYSYFFALWAQGYIYLDYMTKKGVGVGIEPHYILADGKGEGRIYTYYINEQDTKITRWRLDAEHRQQFGNDIDARARFEYLSDKNFSTEYNSSSTVTRWIRSYLSVSKYDPYYTLTTSWQRDDSWDNQDRIYRKTYENLPQVDFRTSTRRIADKIPIYYNLGSTFVNYYTITNDYYIRKFSNDLGLSHSYVLVPRTTHSTNFGIHEIYMDRNDRNVDNMGFIHYYDVTNTLRTQWTRTIETDLSHYFSQRLSKREGDPPNGITTNKLAGVYYYRYLDNISLSVGSGYDFRSTDEFKNRFDPIGTDLRIKFAQDIYYYLNSSYYIATGQINDFYTYLRFGNFPLFGWGYTIGYNYQRFYNISDVYNSLEIPVHTDLRLTGGLTYDTITKLVKEQKYGLSFNITDCWLLESSLIQQRDRNTSFWINLRLRAFPETGIGNSTIPTGYEI